jgi:hypothetical protein
MSVRAWLLTFAVTLVSSGIAQGQESKDKTVAYRWVDEKGVVHYGDRIPAQDTQKEHSILNRQGVEVGRSDAQRSPAQTAEDARREQERLRLQQHDSFLLTTYTSAKDAAEQYVENLNSRLATLQSLALTFKPYSARPGARRMPDDIAENLVRAMSELRTQRNTLASKDKEEQAVRTEFDGDIQRYKELRAKIQTR